RAKHLFPAGLLAGVGRVGYADHDFIGAVFQERRDIEMERIEAAVVGAYEASVNPEDALEVHCTEMEQNALAFPGGGDLELPALPEALIGLQCFTHAREGRLDREGHQKLAVELRRLGSGPRRDRIIPQAVQI